MGSIHGEVIGFQTLPKPSSRTMTLGSTQPLTGMSTRYLPGGKGRLMRKARTSSTSVSRLCTKSGSLAYGPPRMALLYLEVMTAKRTIFWHVAPCHVTEVSRHFDLEHEDACVLPKRLHPHRPTGVSLLAQPKRPYRCMIAQILDRNRSLFCSVQFCLGSLRCGGERPHGSTTRLQDHPNATAD
jgi:hypothetical protein